MSTSRFRPGRASVSALLLGVAFALFVSSSALAQNRGKSGRGENANAKKKTEYWAVVRVGDDFQVVKKTELKSLKKRISEQYRNEVKAYAKAKAAAAKAKEPFKEPKPVMPKVKVLKQSFKSEGEANTYRDRMKSKGTGSEKKSRTPARSDRDKPAAYAIADVGGEMKIVEKSELAEMKKRADQNYRQALKDYVQAKKEAAKKKEKFNDPKPQKATIKTVGPIFKTREKAEEFLQKMREKKEKKSRGKKGSDR